jgi:hypothetical protein
MSRIGVRSERDFISDFPVDFGKGVRADFVYKGNKVAGILLAHHRPDGYVCGTSVFWKKVGDKPLVRVKSLEPLTIVEALRCSCGLHGWIKEGQWEHAVDSIQ